MKQRKTGKLCLNELSTGMSQSSGDQITYLVLPDKEAESWGVKVTAEV